MTLRVCLLDTSIRGTMGSMHRYRDQLLRAFSQATDSELDVEVCFLGLSNEMFHATPARFRMWRHHWHIWRSARRTDFASFDVLHLLDGSFGYVALAVDRAKVVCTVHDVIPRLQMEGRFPTAPRIRRGAQWLIKRTLEGLSASRLVLSVSESTAVDTARFGVQPSLGMKVVPNAVEPDLFESRSSNQRVKSVGSELNLPKRYLFHLGNNGFYKNRAGAFEIFRRMDRSLDLSLVLAGPAIESGLKDAIKHAGLEGRVIEIIDPTQETVVDLYSNAAAFVFPSLYEGFGWPPLEAMSVGCPVVSSNAGSLAEVVGDGGVVEESGDYGAMGRACERIIRDRDFREDLMIRGRRRVADFSLEKLSDSMTAAYRQISDAQEEQL